MPAAPVVPPCDEPALVCFTGRTEIAWLRVLKPGFRHCFCLLPLGAGAWLLVDPRCNRLEVRPVLGQTRQSLTRHFERAGYRVVTTLPAPTALAETAAWPSLVPAPYSCVEAVKRALGRPAPWVVTPYGLYAELRKNAEAEKRC